MTESEWLSSDDPRAMLNHFRREWDKGGEYCEGVSDRKLRMFACAVARVNGHDAKSVAIVEDCVEAGQPNHSFSDQDAIDRGQFWKRCQSADAARGAAHAYGGARTADLLRDIVGNPFRPVTLPTVTEVFPVKARAMIATATTDYMACKVTCPWLTPTVLSLAHAAYEERQPDGALDPVRLAILADALEEAGCPAQPAGRTKAQVIESRRHAVMGGCCDRFADRQACDCLAAATDEGLLEHLRSPGPHVRCCWAIDLILGKS